MAIPQHKSAHDSLTTPPPRLAHGVDLVAKRIPRAQYEASVRRFAEWLETAVPGAEMERRQLLSLYGEFCEFSGILPLTENQLLRRLRAAGVEKIREPVGKKRRYFYVVCSADVVHLDRRRA